MEEIDYGAVLFGEKEQKITQLETELATVEGAKSLLEDRRSTCIDLFVDDPCPSGKKAMMELDRQMAVVDEKITKLRSEVGQQQQALTQHKQFAYLEPRLAQPEFRQRLQTEIRNCVSGIQVFSVGLEGRNPRLPSDDLDEALLQTCEAAILRAHIELNSNPEHSLFPLFLVTFQNGKRRIVIADEQNGESLVAVFETLEQDPGSVLNGKAWHTVTDGDVTICMEKSPIVDTLGANK